MAEESAQRAVLAKLVDLTVSSPNSHHGMKVHVREWAVCSGEFWVIGGRSGTGKSLILAAIAGLLPADSGELILQKSGNPDGGPPSAALVFERGGRLFRDMTVWENVALAPSYHSMGDPGEIEDRVNLILQDLGLAEVAGLRPPELHRSMHGRVALARALITRPEVLLLDDPLGDADPATRKWWIATLSRLISGELSWAADSMGVAVGCEDVSPWQEMLTHAAWVEDGEFREVSKDALQRLHLEIGNKESLASDRAPQKD